MQEKILQHFNTAADRKWVPPMNNLVKVAGPDGAGLESTLRKAIHHVQSVASSESRYGHEMNLQHVNDLMYQHTRNAVARHMGTMDPTVQQYVDVQLSKIRAGITASDIFPENQ